jgi:hypothetical protein
LGLKRDGGKCVEHLVKKKKKIKLIQLFRETLDREQYGKEDNNNNEYGSQDSDDENKSSFY